MKLFLDSKNRRFIKSAASNVALQTLVLKRRDQVPIEVVFVENGVAIDPPAGTQTTVALKSSFSDSNFLALAAPGQTILDLNTLPVEAAFSSDQASIPAFLEIRWTATTQALRTATLQVEIQNSVILGDEGTPAAIPDGKATQAEAESGESNDKWMTPLRTAQAIAELAPPPTWESVLAKPTEFPSEAHTHTASDITDFAEAVVAVSPPVDWSSLTGKPETFAPSAHPHAISEVTGLQAALDDASDRIDLLAENLGTENLDSIAEAAASINTLQEQVDGKAPAIHTHAAEDITGLSSFIIASAPGIQINTTVRFGDGVSVTFPIDGLAGNDPEHVLVALNGVTQTPVTDYTVSEASGTITFDEPPSAGMQISCTALGLRTVQPPIDPTLYLYAFDQSLDGFTTYSGRLLNADRPAAPALPETATSWTIRRSTLSAAGQILATASAVGSWANRETLVYA
jgi:hypothetical protein